MINKVKCYQKRISVFFAAIILTITYIFSNTSVPVLAAGTTLDSYDSITDIGKKLLPTGTYNIGTNGDALFFQSIEYGQNKYNLTVDAVYQENTSSDQDCIRFIVAKAKDTYNNDEEVTLEVVIRNGNVYVFATQTNGALTSFKNIYLPQGTVGQKNSYAIRYANEKLWFYENDQAVISGLKLEGGRYADVEPYVGLGLRRTSGTFSNLRLWGKGVEYYGDFPAMPSGNGDYAPYIGIKKRTGTTAEYTNEVLKNTQTKSSVVEFTKLPFTNQDTYAWSFEVNVQEASETYYGVRPIIRADEDFKNQYQLYLLDGLVAIVYNSKEIARATYDRELGKTDKVGLVVESDAVSVWINDVMVMDSVPLEHELPATMGMHFERAKAIVKNMHFYYTAPTKFVTPEADPVMPTLKSGMYNAAQYMKVMDNGTEIAYSDYTVKRVQSPSNIYVYENIPLSETGTYTYHTKMTITQGFEKGWQGPRILFRSSSEGNIYLAFLDSMVAVLIGDNKGLENYPMTVKVGQTYDVVIHSDADEVSVWLDGKLIFNRVQLSETGEKTKAKPGIRFEGCYATLADLEIFDKSIVLTDDIFDLELHNNKFFNATKVPVKPEGNINYFTNVKLSNADLNRGRRYQDGVLKIPLSSTTVNYQFVDQNGQEHLNGLKKSTTFVWHSKVKATRLSSIEIEGEAKKTAGMVYTFKQSSHTSGTNVNYRMSFVMLEDRLELQIWQDSRQIRNYAKNFTFEPEKEYAVDILTGKGWAKIWLDNELIFTAYELPDYQLYFNITATNMQATVYDFDLYNVETDKDAKILPLADEKKVTFAGDTIASIVGREIRALTNGKLIWSIVGCVCIGLAIAGVVVYGVRTKRKGKTKVGEESEQ